VRLVVSVILVNNPRVIDTFPGQHKSPETNGFEMGAEYWPFGSEARRWSRLEESVMHTNELIARLHRDHIGNAACTLAGC